MTIEITRAVRDDVAAVLVAYATGVDRRDWALFRSCFVDDCVADYGAIGRWHGADEITDWMRTTHEPCGHTLHRITNMTVRPNGDGVAASAYVDAIVMFADNLTGTRAAGSYDDELVRTDEGWKIARRTFTSALLQMIPDGTVFRLDG